MAVIHKNLTGDEAIHEIMYVQSSDPGAVGANKFWLDTTGGATLTAGAILKQRDGTNTSWTTRADVKTALDLKAPLASPALTGTPTAPTASLGDNSTQIATTAYVDSTISAGGISPTIVDAKGDLIAATAADTVARLPVGSNGAILKAASGESTGLKWEKPDMEFTVAASDETTAITAGAAKVKFRMSRAMTLTEVRASLSTASASGGPVTIDINEAGVSILSTKLTIDDGETTSTTAATPAVISDASLADDAEITIDVDDEGSGAAGLKVTFIGRRA